MGSLKFRILLVVLLALTTQLACAQGSWVKAAIPATQFLRSVCFTDSLYGWVAGDSGTMVHTVNGGNSWIRQNTNTFNDIEYVFFLNRNLGWASEFNFTTSPYGTILLNTTDGGATWHRQPYPVENIFMTCILFTDSLHGWMGGKPNGIYKTVNGGASWSQAVIDTSTLAFFPVLDIRFYDQQKGYASGGILDVAGVIWKTTNGGLNWQAIDPAYAPADEVHKLHLFDADNVMGAGGDPDFGYGVGMITTNDGGSSWIYHELPIQGNAYDLDFRNDTEAWAPLGTKRKLIYSLDAGVTWTPIPTPDSTSIYDMIFTDSLHGYAVGKEGAFLKYHPPVVPAVEPVPLTKEGYVLYGNHPNPCSTVTNITFSIPCASAGNSAGGRDLLSPVQIAVTDILGHEVAILPCTENYPGSHSLPFNTGSLAAGCYLYRLQACHSVYYYTVAGPERMVILGER